MDNASSLTGGTVLLRSVSIFLSNRRQSKLLKDQAQKSDKKKRTKTLSKLDEQMGKLQPKMLESLKRKTHFNKWVEKQTETKKKFLEKNVVKCGYKKFEWFIVWHRKNDSCISLFVYWSNEGSLTSMWGKVSAWKITKLWKVCCVLRWQILSNFKLLVINLKFDENFMTNFHGCWFLIRKLFKNFQKPTIYLLK